jgi:tRNA (cmo5U34)-methyltransferase
MEKPDFDVLQHFDSEKSSSYDQEIRKKIPGYEALHDLVHSLLKQHLGREAKVLVVGAGTGQEVISYALENPGWYIVGVDPADNMLDVASQKVASNHLEERVSLHSGYLNSLKAPSPFDAATVLLVMHFLPDDGEKQSLLMEVAQRLKAGAKLILVDLEGSKGSPEFEILFKLWKDYQLEKRSDKDDVEKDFEHILKDIGFVPQSRIEELLRQTGFSKIQKFFQSLLFGGYMAEKLP